MFDEIGDVNCCKSGNFWEYILIELYEKHFGIRYFHVVYVENNLNFVVKNAISFAQVFRVKSGAPKRLGCSILKKFRTITDLFLTCKRPKFQVC